MLEIHRLDPANASSWSLWPLYEKRLRHFLEIQTPDFGDPERCITEIRQRWVTTPQIAGYWLIMAGDSPLMQDAVGHLCGWVQDHYGKPYVILFQAECDVKWESRETFATVIEEAGKWIGEMNSKIEEGNQKLAVGQKPTPPITYIEHWSRKPAEVWNRLIPEIQQEKVYYVIRIAV